MRTATPADRHALADLPFPRPRTGQNAPLNFAGPVQRYELTAPYSSDSVHRSPGPRRNACQISMARFTVLLPAQGLDGVDARGFHGRINPEEDAHAHRDEEAHERRPQRDRGGEGGHRGLYRGRDGQSQRYSERPSDGAQGHGLDEELSDHVAPERAHRAAAPDLARPLGD